MCGRFTLFSSEEALAGIFGVTGSAPSLAPRYNIAPTQAVAVVRPAPDGKGREVALLQWGLIPAWAEDPSIGSRLINARAETVDSRPAFRAAFRHRRCLIPADGFYEWRIRERGRRRQPYYVRMHDGRPFAFAGLWERWEGDEGPIESCALLTTEANGLLAPIHDRMPVILPPDGYDVWLDPSIRDAGPLKTLLGPYPAQEMVAYPVAPAVNNARVDDRRLIDPASAA